MIEGMELLIEKTKSILTKLNKKDDDNSFILLTPPYTAKNMSFITESLSGLGSDYAGVLIKENIPDGLAKSILEKHTLIASVHMPYDIFGKISVQTCLYLFKLRRPHEEDDIVTFIDFSDDGYTRQNRKKSNTHVHDTGSALERYDELVALCLGKKPVTDFYDGKVIKDSIEAGWTFNQHKKIDIMPTEEDFKKTVGEYLAWRASAIIHGQMVGR